MKNVVLFLGGLVFGVGLAVSQMAMPEVVLSFLQLHDFGLLLVMLAAVVVTSGAILASFALKKPLFQKKFQPAKNILDKNTVYGAAIFGLGWGISGVCPGAGLASLGMGNLQILWALAGIALGAFVYGFTSLEK